MLRVSVAVLMILAGAFVGQALAEQPPKCVSADAPKNIMTADATGKVVENVLCCCRTYNGGQCCNYVGFCGGGFVPGCMCSLYHSKDLTERP